MTQFDMILQLLSVRFIQVVALVINVANPITDSFGFLPSQE